MSASSQRSPRKALHYGVAALLFIAWACSGGGGESESAGETEGGAVEYDGQAVLQSAADNVMGPVTEAFNAQVSALVTATQAHADAGSDETLAAARAAWGEAMDAWQVVDALQLGPIGSSSDSVGGADLRDEVYSWPTVNTCRIDQELVAAGYEDADFVGTRLVNVYGLDAIEYLLFHDGPDNTCAPQIDINAEGSWDALGEVELATRRAVYAAVVAEALATPAASIAAAWAPGGEFATALGAPADGATYRTQTEALNELIRALFYLDKMVKDTKVARPAGIRDCSGATCLDGLESQWAARSREHVLANLRAYRMLFLGGESPDAGSGFDDLLITLGEEALAQTAVADIDAAIAAVEAIPGSFADALVADESALDVAHEKIKVVTDLLKGDLVTLLTLNVPSEAAGDAD